MLNSFASRYRHRDEARHAGSPCCRAWQPVGKRITQLSQCCIPSGEARDSSLLKRSSSHAEDCGGEFYAAPKFSRNSSP